MRRNFSQSGHDPVDRDRLAATASHFDAVDRDEDFVVEIARDREIESAWLARFPCGLGSPPGVGCGLLGGSPCVCRGLLGGFECLLNLRRNVFAPFLCRRLQLGERGERLRAPVRELAGCDFVQIVAERLRKRKDALACNSFSGLRVCSAFEHNQLFEKLELNRGPEVSNSQDDPEVTEVGRRFVGPPLIKAYRSHDRVDRENSEQDAFIESTQTPLLQECLRRKPKRGCEARQQERDRSKQGQDPSRAVCPFGVLLTQTLVIDKPFLFQPSELMEECLDEFWEVQLGGGLGIKLDRAEGISRHIAWHRGPLEDSPSPLP